MHGNSKERLLQRPRGLMGSPAQKSETDEATVNVLEHVLELIKVFGWL